MQPCYISLVCHARSNSNDVIALAINIPRQIEAREGEGGGGRGGRGGKVEKGGLEYAVLFLSVSVVRLYEGDVLSMSCTHNCTFRGLILAERSREQTRRSTYRNIG